MNPKMAVLGASTTGEGVGGASTTEAVGASGEEEDSMIGEVVAVGEAEGASIGDAEVEEALTGGDVGASTEGGGEGIAGDEDSVEEDVVEGTGTHGVETKEETGEGSMIGKVLVEMTMLKTKKLSLIKLVSSIY